MTLLKLEDVAEITLKEQRRMTMYHIGDIFKPQQIYNRSEFVLIERIGLRETYHTKDGRFGCQFSIGASYNMLYSLEDLER